MQFETATDFRRSLETRLKNKARQEQIDLQRLRRQVAFDRLLARLFHSGEPPFVLKGGYAMELRLVTARATKDLDLTTFLRSTDQVHQGLLELGTIDLHDYFVFQIDRPRIELENAPYGGARFPVVARLDSRPFVQFHLDVGADIVIESKEEREGTDWLGYCGIKPPVISMISIEQQLAEKLHAYTRPRELGHNTRVKDLVDMLLLLRMRKLEPAHCKAVMERVFRVLGSHHLPTALSPPPAQWAEPFAAMARECGLAPDLEGAFKEVQRIYIGLI